MNYDLILHSFFNDFNEVKNTTIKIPIEIILKGISYISKNAVAIPPAVPNVVIIEKPTGPQLQAPADAPIIVPNKLTPILLVFLICLILKMFIDITIPAKIDKIRINEKFTMDSG